MHTLCLASLSFALEEEDQKGIVLALQTQDPLEGWEPGWAEQHPGQSRELWGTNASEGQRSGSVEVRGPGPGLDHMSACSLSLPHWPILSSLCRKKSNRSCCVPGVHALNWISQRKTHGNRNTVRRMKTKEPALNTASLFPPNGRHPQIRGHLGSLQTALCLDEQTGSEEWSVV